MRINRCNLYTSTQSVYQALFSWRRGPGDEASQELGFVHQLVTYSNESLVAVVHAFEFVSSHCGLGMHGLGACSL